MMPWVLGLERPGDGNGVPPAAVMAATHFIRARLDGGVVDDEGMPALRREGLGDGGPIPLGCAG